VDRKGDMPVGKGLERFLDPFGKQQRFFGGTTGTNYSLAAGETHKVTITATCAENPGQSVFRNTTLDKSVDGPLNFLP